MNDTENNLNETYDKIIVKKHPRFFDVYITKVLRQIGGSEITTNARHQLNSILISLSKKITEICWNFVESSKTKTVGLKEVSGAIDIVFKGELLAKSSEMANEAVSKFLESINNTKDENESVSNESKDEDEELVDKKKKIVSRNSRAGILFPPSICEKFIRRFGYGKIMVSNTAPIYLASVLEYFTQDILSAAQIVCRENKKIRLTVRDLELGVRHDEDLNATFKFNNLEFLGGGISPYINSMILNKLKKSKDRIDKDGKKRDRSFTLRQMKKYQKIGDCLIFSRHPFEQLVRQIVKDSNSSAKISKEVFLVLQYYVEQRVTNILKSANNIAIYNKRVKLFPSDIEMVMSILNMRNPLFFSEEEKEKNIIPTESIEIDIQEVEKNILDDQSEDTESEFEELEDDFDSDSDVSNDS